MGKGGLYCTRCGAINDEAAQHCHLCGASLQQAAPASPKATATSAASTELVICGSCNERVVAARFCGNCGSPLTSSASAPPPASDPQGT